MTGTEPQDQGPRVPQGRFGKYDEGGSGWWITDEVVSHIQRRTGKRILPSMWANYVSNGLAPNPHRYFGGTPMWMSCVVEEWTEGYAGSAVPGWSPAGRGCGLSTETIS